MNSTEILSLSSMKQLCNSRAGNFWNLFQNGIFAVNEEIEFFRITFLSTSASVFYLLCNENKENALQKYSQTLNIFSCVRKENHVTVQSSTNSLSFPSIFVTL